MAISRDNGDSWVIDSPQFYHAAADGPGVTDELFHTHSGLLVAWGHGGNFVNTTPDQGSTWYQTAFPDGVDAVHVHDQVLVARETNWTHQGKRLPDLTYYSGDRGHVWRLVPSASITGSSTPADCPTSSLQITVASYGGSAGQFYQRLEFRNTSQQPCTLTGFPGVSYTNSSGHQVGYPLGGSTCPKVRSTPLCCSPAGPRKRSSTSPTPTITATQPFCQLAPTTHLRIYPPNQRHAGLLPSAGQTCTTRGARIGTGPVRPHR
jgi:hypothetical protein